MGERVRAGVHFPVRNPARAGHDRHRLWMTNSVRLEKAMNAASVHRSGSDELRNLSAQTSYGVVPLISGENVTDSARHTAQRDRASAHGGVPRRPRDAPAEWAFAPEGRRAVRAARRPWPS